MNRILQSIVILVWALWLGGLVTLFLAVGSLFHTFADQPQIAGRAASGIFQLFSRYRLCLAAAALLLTVLWHFARRSRLKITLFVIFALATGAGVYTTAVLTPGLERLRAMGQVDSPQFGRLHELSTNVYLLETILVLAAAWPLAWMGTGKQDAAAPRPVEPT
jgi:hypothetical protein